MALAVLRTRGSRGFLRRKRGRFWRREFTIETQELARDRFLAAGVAPQVVRERELATLLTVALELVDEVEQVRVVEFAGGGHAPILDTRPRARAAW